MLFALFGLEHLPEGSPFTPAVRLVVYVSLTNLCAAVLIVILKIFIYLRVDKLLQEIRDYARITKEWSQTTYEERSKTGTTLAKMVKVAEETAHKTDEKAAELKEEVKKVPDETVKRLADVSQDGMGSGVLKVVTPQSNKIPDHLMSPKRSEGG